MDITIFTPTYNRGHLLKKLYQSLLIQSVTDFEWLIVDDGSSDNTPNVVEEFKSENKVRINYLKKENGGKHSAINYGLNHCTSELFFIVDSDDVLKENAVELIQQKYNFIKDRKDLAGIIGLSEYFNGELLGSQFPKTDWEVSFADVYLKHGVTGDKAVCFKTEILKRYPFPEKAGICFVFEAVVWHEMSKKYDMLALNDVLQKKEYLISGMTDSSYKKWYITSLAFSYFHLINNRTYAFTKYPKAYLWNFVHLGINSLLSETSYFWQLNSVQKIIYLLCFPRAFYSYLNMKKLMREDV